MTDTIEKKCRQSLSDAKRIIIKIGTRVITDEDGKPNRTYLRNLVRQIAEVHAQNREIILVSSGAVGAGMEALGITKRPGNVPDLQMCAAVGQAKIMALYESLFKTCGICIGQVLLTHSDFADTIRLSNAGRALQHLLDRRVIPIINENDVVADEELKSLLSLGDNDYLAALVTRLTHTHLLILLSTVDGLLKPSGSGNRKVRVSCIKNFDDAVRLVNPADVTPGGISKGGMDSKLKAAKIATSSGVPVIIASGRNKHVLNNILMGENEGTLMIPDSL